jgi:ATP-dependent RNA helicase RhlB
MTFSELNLHPDVMAGIDAAGYVECTPVQGEVLQTALEGADLYVQSQTGTGKTAAFIVAILQELLTREELAGKKALIMEPTRELAVQVEEEAKRLASGTGITAASFYGGVGYREQEAALRNNVDIIVGTPGRVIDLEESRTMDLSQVGFLVLDEADRMFDMGFYPDLRKLIKRLPRNADRQTMLFSATLNAYVKNLAWEYTENAREITIEAAQVTVDEIDQSLFHVSSDEKTRLLLHILRTEAPESVLLFCNTKKMSEITAKRLRLNGFETEFIIGDMPQPKRLAVLNKFKKGTIKCLVSTDVAARGIDVDDLAMVINFDVPNEAENYVHRIGRTARAGKTGKAYTFCSEQDVYDLIPIERYLGFSIPVGAVPEDIAAEEDKSAGKYIKLENYDDDRDYDRRGNGRHEFSGENSGSKPQGLRRDSRNRREFSKENSVSEPHGSRRDGRRDNRREFSRGNVAGRTRSPERQRGAGRQSLQRDVGHRDRREPLRENAASQDPALLSLTMEERMKVYQERYRQEGGQNPGRENQRERPRRQQMPPRQQRQNVQQKPPVAVPLANPAEENSGQLPLSPQGGILRKLKSLFGKK